MCLEYKVKPLRDAGLEAKWVKTSKGQPYIVVRDPKAKSPMLRNSWCPVDSHMFDEMKCHGIIRGYRMNAFVELALDCKE